MLSLLLIVFIEQDLYVGLGEELVRLRVSQPAPQKEMMQRGPPEADADLSFLPLSLFHREHFTNLSVILLQGPC